MGDREMKLVKLSELFDVKYGNSLELNSLQIFPHGINFVSRTAKNNGISSKVCVLPHETPIPAGTISVALGGTVLETFYQDQKYYCGRDISYLKSKLDFSKNIMLFYCLCIRKNKYRYNYGRQANRTLKDILVPHPDEIPSWVYEVEVARFILGHWRLSPGLEIFKRRVRCSM